jgi:mxaL protein
MSTLRGSPRTWILIAALLAALAAALLPRIGLQQDVFDLVAVVDITGSMNTRDTGDAARPASRLEAARAGLLRLASRLPCGSRLGLGVFSERRAFLLMEPVALCENYDALTGTIDQIDWRMAWEGDSYIAKGLFSAIEIGASLHSNLLFLTDGHEAPPVRADIAPVFDGKPGEVKGVIVGVGGMVKSPIPKFDADGREIGAYRMQDVPQDNRHGLPPEGSAHPEGWHPRNAPFGPQAITGDEHLSSLREPYLQSLADGTGLGYVRLADDDALLASVQHNARKRSLVTETDIGIYPALGALLLVVVFYGLMPLLTAIRRSSSPIGLK